MAAKKRRDAAFVYVGIRGFVVAVSKETGEVAWRTELRRGGTFVPLTVEDGRIYAASGGEITCLDGETGEQIWHNPLKGYGTGYAMIAGASNASAASAARAEEEAQAAAASSAM